MTQQPFSSAALRGAVDLSGLKARPAAPRGAAPAPGQGAQAPGPGGAGAEGVPGRSGALVHADDATFESVVNASLTTPLVLVLWTPQVPESLQHLRELAQAARGKQGRFQVVGVDLASSPGIMQALTPVLSWSSYPVVSGGNMVRFLKVTPPTLIGSRIFMQRTLISGGWKKHLSRLTMLARPLSASVRAVSHWLDGSVRGWRCLCSRLEFFGKKCLQRRHSMRQKLLFQ